MGRILKKLNKLILNYLNVLNKVKLLKSRVLGCYFRIWYVLLLKMFVFLLVFFFYEGWVYVFYIDNRFV